MRLIDAFSKVSIVVIGDVMLDRYWWGSVRRISPEAPVPVVRMDRMTLAPGGAANVAANVAGLGARAMLIGLTGDDTEGELLSRVLASVGVDSRDLIPFQGRHTTTKTRIIAHSQQVARVDQETISSLSGEEEARALAKCESRIQEAQVVIVSDYAKGFISETLLRHVIDLGKRSGIKVIIDPKGRDYSKYRSAAILTPNRREAADACGLEEDDQSVVDLAGHRLLGELDLEGLLITQGEDGMTLFQRGDERTHLNTHARGVYDVTGAGDTVIATLAVAIAAGADTLSAAELANKAAGLVVEQVGTTVISIDALQTSIDTH